MQCDTVFRYGGKKINPSLICMLTELEMIIISQWELRANSECIM